MSEAYVIGSGVCLPERVVTNEEIAGDLGVSPDDIFRLSGIRCRRWADPDAATSELASASLKTALANANRAASDIDYLILGTMTPDRFIPGTAAAVQKAVALSDIPSLDIRATCCNALYALQLAKALIGTGVASNIAICLAEVQSPWLELRREMAKISMLFGDGGASLIVSGTPRKGAAQIVDIVLQTDGNHIDDLGIRSPGTEFRNAGRDHSIRFAGEVIIRHASDKVVSACNALLRRNDLQISDIRWLVPHQANARLTTQIARNLQFSQTAGEIISVIEETGNTSSASMAIALDSLFRTRQLRTADHVLLPAFGAGFMWGAGLCRIT